MLIAAAVVVALVLAGGLAFQLSIGGWRDALRGTAGEPTFVGSETCAGCHQAEAELWRSSQHKHAMEHATEKSVLGDFSDAASSITACARASSARTGSSWSRPTGRTASSPTFEVKYTFGLDPLQQYLIEFPDGRLQALSIAWDSRPKDSGGQRWFHLYPDEEIKHDDVLHWTKLNQNWNFMCAECHSTGVRKNYDAANDRFATTWAEISVGCEACHGQGSRHVAWARDAAELVAVRQERRSEHGAARPLRRAARRHLADRSATGNAAAQRRAGDAAQGGRDLRPVPRAPRRSSPRTGCRAGRCPTRTWSRRSARGLYHADGQMLDEVYNYGSFKQSKMFAAGVTCSDCHEPHGAKLRAAGDGVCLQCHAADKYAAATHHRHEARRPGARLRVVPHAGAHLHGGRSRGTITASAFRAPICRRSSARPTPATTATPTRPPNGRRRRSSAGTGRAERACRPTPRRSMRPGTARRDAAALLGAIAGDRNAPAIARASALRRARAIRSRRANIDLARAGLADPDPMVRIGALDMLEGVPAEPALAAGLAAAVRLQSRRAHQGRLAAGGGPDCQPAAGRPRALRARGGRVRRRPASQCRSAGGARDARKLLCAARPRRRGRGRVPRRRCGSSPQYAPAAINLADLYRQLGRDGDGEGVLRTAIAASPRDAGLHHALGLALTRLKRTDEAHRRTSAAPPSSNPIARDTRMSMRSRCIPPVAARGDCRAQGKPGQASGGSRHASGARHLQPRCRRSRRSARICRATGATCAG